MKMLERWKAHLIYCAGRKWTAWSYWETSAMEGLQC
jgi:hypothetical protein